MAGPLPPAKRPAVPYSLTARLYDTIHSWKDYPRESRRVRALVRQYGPPHARTLLDVACGTGNHLRSLSRWYDCTGVDAMEGMLRVARRKLPRVRFVRGRMETLDLGRKFDAITCLFSAIGYVRGEGELRRTFRRFAEHLAPGGVVIVEPWLTPGAYRTGDLHRDTFGTPDLPIVRMSLSARRGHRSILDMHHLAGSARGIRYWIERHDMGLFEVRTYLDALRAAGLRPRYVKSGFRKDRGLFLAVLPKARS